MVFKGLYTFTQHLQLLGSLLIVFCRWQDTNSYFFQVLLKCRISWTLFLYPHTDVLLKAVFERWHQVFTTKPGHLYSEQLSRVSSFTAQDPQLYQVDLSPTVSQESLPIFYSPWHFRLLFHVKVQCCGPAPGNYSV